MDPQSGQEYGFCEYAGRYVMVQTIDFQILDWIQQNMRNPVFDRVMPFLSAIGGFGIIWILIGLFFLIDKRKRPYGIMILAGLLLGLLVGNVVLKHLVARPRPCVLNPSVQLLVSMPKGYSFPSGHTLSAFIGATVLCCYKRSWGIPALILAGLIAFSRLYLYVHFPSDVLAGLVLGVVIGLVTVFLYGKIMRKDKKQPDTN